MVLPGPRDHGAFPHGVVVTRAPITWIEIPDPAGRFMWERHSDMMAWCHREMGVHRTDWDMCWRGGRYHWRFRTKEQAFHFQLVWC